MIPPYAKIFEPNPHDEGTKLASMLRTHTHRIPYFEGQDDDQRHVGDPIDPAS